MRLLIQVAVVGAMCLVVGCSSALADTTHPFLGDITLPTGEEEVQPVGVDASGNLIVWLNNQRAVAKYDIHGNPVNFSALGTNMIDGAGGFDCPTTPSDCDRVPSDGFRETIFGVINPNVAVDNSGGPANGYIYVQNNQGEFKSEVDVFDAAGEFKGKIDESQAQPRNGDSTLPTEGISVAADGSVYIDHNDLALDHIDRYVPINGNPADDEFSGQIRAPCFTGACTGTEIGFSTLAAGPNYVYTGGGDATHGHERKPETSSFYAKFPQREFHRPGLLNYAESIDFSPDIGPFGNGGFFPPFNSPLPIIGIDPANEHVYIGDGWAGFKEYDPANHQIGPMFGDKGCPGSPPDPTASCPIGPYQATRSIAFDRSVGPTNGRIYVHGPEDNEIAIFGPPVVIPSVTYGPATAGHTSAELSGTIDPAGGPEVTGCQIEWGEDESYGHTTPCTPAPPYTTGASITASISGLEVEHDYHYRIVAENANGENAGPDHVFHTLAVLGVKTEPASDVTPAEATLNGSLNPDGMATEYQFEYGLGTNYPEKTALFQAPSGSTQAPVPPMTVSGLQSGKTYHYRLVASNILGTSYGGDQQFTAPSAPEVSSLYASDVTETGATLHARINPFGYDTSYEIEYGTTPSYGNALPAVDIGTGTAPQDIVGHINDLQPGVTYHFRVVATNKWGTTDSLDATFNFLPPQCPNSHVRQQTSANYLPDCRAYELVSPSDAGALQLFPGDVTVGIANGEQGFQLGLTFVGPNASGQAESPPRFGFFGGEGSITGLHPPNTLLDRYVATRTNRGWVTTYPGRQGNEEFLAVNPLCDLSMDKCIDDRYLDFFYSSNVPPGTGPPEPTASSAPYVWNVDGTSRGRWPTNVDEVTGADQFVGDTRPSPDFSHFLFSSRDLKFATGGLESAPGSVYDNDISAATVTISSKLQNGSPIPQEPSSVGNTAEYIKVPAVSTDGSHVLMSTATPQGTVHLYMRVNDATTYDVSDGADVTYVGMTSDGSKVYFTSRERLRGTDTDNSADLYMWSQATDALTLVSVGNGNGNSNSCNASWTSGCDVQPLTTQRPDLDDTLAAGNGDFYFYSPEQLDGADPGIRNERNLYDYRNGHVQYVTTLDPGTQIDRMQISPDDSHMAFLTRSQVTSYDNEGWEEMYTYEPSTGAIQCASCIPTGQPPTIGHDDPRSTHPGSTKDVEASKSGRFMSNDGRVAFSTSDALVSTDTDQTADVYEFVGGKPQLITAGTGNQVQVAPALFYPGVDTGFEAISANGQDLYFSTFDTLVPQDHNGSFVKFYDARTNGGFPVNPPALPCPSADECHGDSSVAPAPLQNGSQAGLGSRGNVGAPVRKHDGKRRRHRRHHKKRHARHAHSPSRRDRMGG